MWSISFYILAYDKDMSHGTNNDNVDFILTSEQKVTLKQKMDLYHRDGHYGEALGRHRK